MTIKIFNRIFLSFLLLVALTFAAFWTFSYRDTASSTGEKIAGTISLIIQNMAKSTDQFFALRDFELTAISKMPDINLFFSQEGFLKTKMRMYVAENLISLAEGNKAIERIRILESNYFKSEPTAIDVKEKKNQFNKAEFIETLKIGRDTDVSDRLEEKTDYVLESNTKFIEDMVGAGKISYAETVSDDVQYLSLGKIVKKESSGEVVGIVIIDLSLPYLKEFLQSPQSTYIKRLSLQNTSGNLLYESQATKDGYPLKTDKLDELSTDLFKGFSTVEFLNKLQNSGLNLIFDIDSRLAWHTLQKARLMPFLFLVCFTLVSLTISYFLSRSIATPIKILNEEIGQFSEGRTKEIAAHTNVAEVKELANTFNKLINRLEEHKKELNVRARLAAIGKSAAMIAHDIRSPLSVIMGYFDKNKSLEESDKYYSIAKKSAEKLNKIAEDMQAFSSATNLSKTNVNIADVIKDVAAEFALNELAENVSIHCDTPSAIWAKIDHDKLNRVLSNLVINSLQACREGKGRIEIKAYTDNNSLVIEVTDNGRGISEENMQSIFDTFFTAGKTKGSGLGLSYCKQAIEAHDGRITVKSTPHKGTTFTITIPNCVMGDPTLVTVADEELKVRLKTDSQASTVLVIDDDLEILEWWKENCSKRSRNVITVKSGNELLKLDLDYSKIGSAIVDYSFDGSNITGLEIIKYLKLKNVENIYLCTGYYKDKEICERAIKLGARFVIPKPMNENIFETI